MTTTCKPDCGKPGGMGHMIPGYLDGVWLRFCSVSCRDAGRALHPVSKPPGEPAPAKCPTCQGHPDAEFDGDIPCPDCNPSPRGKCGGKGYETVLPGENVDCPGCLDCRPGSAPPLPVTDPLCKHGQLSHWCLPCVTSDLAEARTALAGREAELAESHALYDAAIERNASVRMQLRTLRARLAVTVGALERINAIGCECRSGEVTCAFDIARRALAALAHTGAPPAKKEE